MEDQRLFQYGNGGRVRSTYGVVVVIMLASAVALRITEASMLVVGLVLFTEAVILPVMGLGGRFGEPWRVVVTHLGWLFALGLLAGVLGTWATANQAG